MNSRRMTLGPVSSSTASARSNIGAGSMGAAAAASKRMSIGVAVRPPVAAMAGMPAAAASTSTATASRRMSMGAALPPPARKDSVGITAAAMRKPSMVSVANRGSTLTTGRAVDNRDICSKSFMNASIRTLLNYLVEHGYDQPINPKILTRPSVKDFHNIIDFLFKQLDPNFSFKDRFEDEVVVMFKHLGYPTAISKSNIAAVGSPHAWPSIMAAMMWLIELLNYDEVCVSNPAEDADDLSDKAFYSYLAESYGLFLEGDDAGHSALEQEFQADLLRKNSMLVESTEQTEADNAQLERAIEEAEGRRATLPELEDKKVAYISDLGKFEELIEQLEKHKTQLHTKTQDREAELERLTVAVTAVKEEIGALSSRVNTQELSAEDVEKLVMERERLEEQQNHASETRQAIQNKVWESEMKLRDSVQALDDSTRAYNSIAEDLKLVPHTARNARGRNLTLSVDTRAKTGAGLLKSDVAKDVIPHLNSLQSELENHTQGLRAELVKQQESQEEIESNRIELEEQKSLAETKSRKSEDAYKREKEALDEVLRLNQMEVESMEKRLLQLRDTAQEEASAAAALRKAEEIKSSNDTLRIDHERTKKEIIAAVMEVVSSCATHRELVRSRLDAVKGKHAQQLQVQLDFIDKFANLEVARIMPPKPPALAMA